MDENQILHKISTDQLLIVYYSVPTCSVCKVLRPKVEELVAGYDIATFLYVNIENHPAIKGLQIVFTVPTVILYGQGKEIQRWSRHFSVADLRRMLDRYNQLLANE